MTAGEKLGYLSNQGITYLHLMPLLKNASPWMEEMQKYVCSSFHPYQGL